MAIKGTRSTSYNSDLEKNEPPFKDETATIGYPDSAHEEVEEMDEGHLDDLARQYVSIR